MERKISVVDYRRVYTGNVLRVDMLVNCNGEYQYHYISMDRMEEEHNFYNNITEYLDKNVRWRNLSDEEQENNIKAFKGGRL